MNEDKTRHFTDILFKIFFTFLVSSGVYLIILVLAIFTKIADQELFSKPCETNKRTIEETKE